MKLKNAILLAGGEGTRLRPMTHVIPKPLAQVAGVALLEIILRQLASQGIERVALALGYRAEAIRKFCGDGSRFDLHLDFFTEPFPLGSGGAIGNVVQNAREYSQAPLLIANADVPSTADFRAAFSLHQKRDAIATLICGRAESLDGLGAVEIEADGRVTAFHEKPAPGVTNARWANLAFWIFGPRLLERFSAQRCWRVEDELFPQLLRDGEPLFAYRHDGFWLDVGTLPRYLAAQRAALDGVLAVPGVGKITREYSQTAPSLLAPRARVAKDAQLHYASIGENARIESGAILEDAVIYPSAVVERGASVQRAVVGPGVHVLAGTSLRDEMSFDAAEN